MNLHYPTIELALPNNLGINPVFIVENLIPYHAPFDYPIMTSDLTSSTSQGHQPFFIFTSPLPIQRKHLFVKIKDIWIRLFRLLMAGISAIWFTGMDIHIQIALSCAPRRTCSSPQICYVSSSLFTGDSYFKAGEN